MLSIRERIDKIINRGRAPELAVRYPEKISRLGGNTFCVISAVIHIIHGLTRGNSDETILNIKSSDTVRGEEPHGTAELAPAGVSGVVD